MEDDDVSKSNSKSKSTITIIGDNEKKKEEELEEEDEEEEKKNKPPLKLDMNVLLGSDINGPDVNLVVDYKSRNQRRLERKRRRIAEIEAAQNSGNNNNNNHNNDDDDDGNGGGASSACTAEELSSKSDHDLELLIGRMSRNVNALGPKLRDGGAKLKAKLKLYKDEFERRKLRRPQQVANGCKTPADNGSPINNGVLNGSEQAVQPSQSSDMSLFASLYTKKLEDDNPKEEQNTSNQARKAFDNEISHLNPCGKRSVKKSDKLLPSRRKPSLSSEGFNTWRSDDNSLRKSKKFMSLNGKLAGKISSTSSIPYQWKKIGGSIADKDVSQALNSDCFKIEKTVVLVDEEEPEICEQEQEAIDLPSRPNEGKIYYPSREDPESLEILRSELKCLEPEECLTSTIMNFYIRFLQERYSADTSRNNFYFFNTYFYSKLQEAVAYQKSDKEAVFKKFRRWWKGVNIFQKAYILLPINEDNHWSLVIICLPGKEDDTGLMMLHLDSLGLHSSSSIFKNIRSLLRNEWEILNEDGGAVNSPIPDRIWKYLPGKIEEEIIAVPRQTNDYDCGLFVLYYMERFIKEAPERLRREHFDKSPLFGKGWFKPKEASSLRGKIKDILRGEFCKALEGDNCIWEPVSLSSKAGTTNAIDQADIS